MLVENGTAVNVRLFNASDYHEVDLVVRIEYIEAGKFHYVLLACST